MNGASPWAGLLNTNPLPAYQKPPASPTAHFRTKLEKLLAALDDLNSATTVELAQHCGMTTRQVWGLLKSPHQRGQVRNTVGEWSLVQDYAGHAIEKAAELLRENGWRVMPPCKP